MRRRGAVRTLLACALLVWLGAASAIAYTVQVIAVSDQESALSISRDLLRDGYPAYVVRSTGAQGDVFRVRVGAFANRAAALRYAESMPEVAGSRPVPALAEAIPQGIMPLAPRLLWQGSVDGQDVRVLPWPGGVALRLQPTEPLREATYLVFHDGHERRFDAWAALPLRRVPEPAASPEIDVPIVDLTVPAGAEEATEPALEDDAAAGGGDTSNDGADVVPAEPVEAGPAPDPLVEALRAVAAPDDEEPEVGLLLLRDRSLWPPSWRDDDESVRNAFQSSLTTIVARELDVDTEAVAAAAYLPAGAPPPALIVLDVSTWDGRDAGRPVALADPTAGVRLFGPDRFVGALPVEALPSWPAQRLRVSDTPPESVGGEAWQVRADAGFVRITLPDGATWRAGVGTPLWSDGRSVLAYDGTRLLLYDFVRR